MEHGRRGGEHADAWVWRAVWVASRRSIRAYRSIRQFALAVRKPAKGGVVTFAEHRAVDRRTSSPSTPAADLSVYDVSQFQQFFWPALWWSPKGASRPSTTARAWASPPEYSDGNKTITITLKPGWKWSDGTPMTSPTWTSMRPAKAAVGGSPANYGDYTPGLYPDNVTSVATPNPSTFVINFNKGYNQNFIFLESSGSGAAARSAWAKTSLTGPIIPFNNLKNAAAIYKFLNTQSDKLSTYGSNPLWQVVDGPFKIKSFDPADRRQHPGGQPGLHRAR